MTIELNRREFLKASGSLVVSVSASGVLQSALVPSAQAQTASFASPTPESLDTWIAIGPNGTVTGFFGKVDHGQGLSTAIAQIVAEELDVSVDKVEIRMGDTTLTPNQGGASASTGIRTGANPLRNAAAEARRLITVAAGERFGVPAESIGTADGVAFVRSDPARRARYEELFGGRPFGARLEWNKQTGNGMNASGAAKPKPVAEYKVVGQPVPRKDIPAKMLGTEDYVCNVRVPGMLHGRVVRPTVSGAVPVTVDETSIRGIRGARVVRKGDFLGVVADTEWDAIKAARALKVEWSKASPNFPGHDGLYEHIRKATPVASNGQNLFLGKKAFNEAPVEEALKKSSRVIEAEYECAFQSHARMGPSVGVADVKDGVATVWTDTQKPHFHREGLAKLLGIPEEKIRVNWKDGAGSYGRSDADEASFEAAVMSQAIGRPVRVQWMRSEGTAWDPKAPAAVVTMKAGVNAANGIDAWYFRAKGFSGWDVKWFADAPEHTIVGMQVGHKKWDRHNFDTPHESYQFPTAVSFWQTIAPLQEQASPLRCAHLRAPQEFQTHFAQECFVDEVAAAIGADPLALRLQHLKNPREIAVLKAAAEKAGWGADDAKPRRQAGNVQRGRGISLHAGYGSFVAVVADVEVNRTSGRVWARRVTVANDSGLVVNPSSLRLVLEGNVMQGLSRTLFEEVRFDRNMVTSADWLTYPIADVKDAPEAIDIVLLNNPGVPYGGAGEPALVAVVAAVGNAIYNATGVRVRRFPFTAERVKKALLA